MINLHPLIVHFPIALFLTSFLLDVVGVIFSKENFKRAGFYNLALAFLGALTAVYSGGIAEHDAQKLGVAPHIIHSHENFAYISLWAIIGIFLFRTIFAKTTIKKLRLLYLLVALAGVVLISLTGYYGGEIVKAMIFRD